LSVAASSRGVITRGKAASLKMEHKNHQRSAAYFPASIANIITSSCQYQRFING
jgi:hypothetical protein